METSSAAAVATTALAESPASEKQVAVASSLPQNGVNGEAKLSVHESSVMLR